MREERLERLGAAVAVRLEHADDAVEAKLGGGTERGRDLCGVMPVVVDDRDAVDVAHVREATTRALELGELLGGLRDVCAKHVRHGDDAKQLLSLCKEEGRLASLSQVFCRFLQLFRDSQFSRNKRVISSVKHFTFTACNQAISGQRLKVCSFSWCDLFFLSTL